VLGVLNKIQPFAVEGNAQIRRRFHLREYFVVNLKVSVGSENYALLWREFHAECLCPVWQQSSEACISWCVSEKSTTSSAKSKTIGTQAVGNHRVSVELDEHWVDE
jgi:hypothetical protein